MHRKLSSYCRQTIFGLGMTAVLFAVPAALYAQNQTVSANLSGIVTDASGARIGNATVTLSSPEKGITRTYQTDANGSYTFTLLPPTTYNLVVQAPGFEGYKQNGITLEVGQSASQNIGLTIGSAKDEVVVSGQAPLLNTADANLSAEVTGKQVVELPLNLRNIYGLATLNSSVSSAQEGQRVNGGGTQDTADQDISFLNFGGGFFGTTAFLLDGVWDTASDWGAVVYVPSVDSVQEFRIQTNSFTAQYGWSTGNVINVLTKSGSNAFHGDAFEFYRNSALDANSYFNNFFGNKKPDFNRHQFGASAGGPLYLPGLYKQREKTFLFGLYEGLRQSTPGTFTGTVPTTAFRSGDFSALLGAPTGKVDALGRPILSGQIYNPYSTRRITQGQVDPSTGLIATSSGYIRDPFQGNNVAAAISPVAASLTKFFPTPVNDQLTNNYSAAASAPASADEYTIRGDHNLSDASRLFVRWSQKREYKTNSPDFYGSNDPGGPGNVRPNNRYNFTIGYNHIFNATTAMSLTGGLNRWVEGTKSQGYPFRPSTVGLPTFLDQNGSIFPIVNVEGQSSLGPVQGGQGSGVRNVGSISADVTKILGVHSLAIGYMGALMQNNGTNVPGAAFGFDHGFTAGPDPSATSSNTGYGFASLLIGTASYGNTSNNFNPAVSKKYQGVYVQDDWKPTQRLTLNLGLRYEFQQAPTERHNRQAYFDYKAINPISAAVGESLPGELVFNGNGHRRGLYDTNYNNVAPRFGFAFQVDPKLVVRGGYGIFFAPQYFGGAPSPGFNQSTPVVTSVDGVTPFSTLDNPFPKGLRAPSGSSLGGLQDVGFSTSGIPSERHSPYIQQYSFGMQYAFSNNDVLKATYVGNHGTHLLLSSYNHSQLNPSYLAMGSALLNPVANPFYGKITSSGCGLDQPTIPAGQLMQPYPQYCSVGESQAPVGFSNYNALQVDYNHRLTSGLNMLVSYTYSKFLDNVEGTNDWAYNGGSGVRNFYNLAAEKSVDASDTPHSLVVNYIYELPVGRGKKYGSGFNRATNAALGGWQVSGITTLHSGFPLGITGGGNSNLFGGNQRPDLTGDPNAVHKTINHWFNTAAFSAPQPYTFGDVPRLLAKTRSPGYDNWDIGIQKWWNFSEQLRLQFRGELFNAFNHANFYAPDTNLTDGGFGTIRQSFGPRDVQIAGKLYW